MKTKLAGITHAQALALARSERMAARGKRGTLAGSTFGFTEATAKSLVRAGLFTTEEESLGTRYCITELGKSRLSAYRAELESYKTEIEAFVALMGRGV